MPRFAEEDVRCLKSTMALRLPDCYFTLDDVEAIKAKTSLGESQIQQWSDNMRYRVSAEKRAAYFAADEENDKV
jgi:hypothetical protein